MDNMPDSYLLFEGNTDMHNEGLVSVKIFRDHYKNLETLDMLSK